MSLWTLIFIAAGVALLIVFIRILSHIGETKEKTWGEIFNDKK